MASLKNIDETIRLLAHRNYAIALKACQTVTQAEAAKRLGQPASSFSEWKDDHLERAMQVLSALGLKAVDAREKTYSPRRIANLIDLSIEQLERERAALEDDITVPGTLGD